MNTETARERAHAGAVFLDRRLGRGWRRKIRRRRLNVENGFVARDPQSVHSRGCVLAQLHLAGAIPGADAPVTGGSYYAAAAALDVAAPVRLGFMAPVGESVTGYERLTEAWLEELRAG